jgi:rod shape-determining protein MreD
VTLDALRIAFALFVAALLQVTLFSSLGLFGGTPDVLLVTLVGVALLRGALTGAVAGFASGLFVDAATLDTLGVSALLLLLVGYWIGRYGEATGRDRAYVQVFSVVVATGAVVLVGSGLHFLLGEAVSARQALGQTLLPGLVLNLLATVPVLALCRAVLGPGPGGERTQEVRLLG